MSCVLCSNNNEYYTPRLRSADGSMKEYDYVVFARGYHQDRPRFLAKFNGTSIVDEVEEQHKKFVDCDEYPCRTKGYFDIKFGQPMVLAPGVVTCCTRKPASGSTLRKTSRVPPEANSSMCARTRSRVRRAMVV